MAETMDTHEDRIRECAYYLWEAEGCPVGRDDEFWNRASQQIVNDVASAMPVKRKVRGTTAQASPKVRSRNRIAPRRDTSEAVVPLA
jgi:hypothetical protein